MQQKRWRICMVVAALLCTPLSVSAAKAPKSLSTDFRMKQIMYDANDVTHIVSSYGYQTTIEFAQDETVRLVTLGDSVAWQTVPYLNRLFIKPVEEEANTNMTVVTNKRIYFFSLESSHHAASGTFLVRFAYPDQTAIGALTSGAVDAHLDNINWDYSTAGNKQAFALKKVFDDSQFTYFLFDEGQDIPAVYIVNAEGDEAIVNTRREGQYLVVERMGAKFTLRNGPSYLCIRNNALLKEAS